jgi:hypothetical protein
MRRALILGAIALAVLSISFPADASTNAVRATTIAPMLRFVDWTAAASPGDGLTVAVVGKSSTRNLHGFGAAGPPPSNGPSPLVRR